MAEEKVSFRLVDALQEVLPREEMDLLLARSTATNNELWQAVLERLSLPLKSGNDLATLYSWELRSSLLQIWGQIPTLLKNVTILYWLDLRWSEVGNFLSLDLPQDWQFTAIHLLFTKAFDIPASQAISIITHYAAIFEKSLQQLMLDVNTQRIAINFFAILVQYGYLAKMRLLGTLLNAGPYQKEHREFLLTAAALEPVEVVDLLENYCQSTLASQMLPPLLLTLIKNYLYSLNVEDLELRPTHNFLQLLQKRNENPTLRLPVDIQPYLQGWLKISTLLNKLLFGKTWLNALSHTIRAMPLLQPEALHRLGDRIIPLLVTHVMSESELIRALDALGPVLLQKGARGLEQELQLLERMVSLAGEKYGGDSPPARIAPYIKVVFEESRFAPSYEKEQFIDRCITTLLKEIDITTFTLLDKNSIFWSPYAQLEWKAYAYHYNLPASLQVTYQHSPSTVPVPPVLSVGPGQMAAATINAIPITFAWLRKMATIKGMYLHYEHQMRQQEHPKGSSHKINYPLNDDQVRTATLDDLIDDICIQDGIKEALQHHGVSPMNFDTNRLLPALFQSFKTFSAGHYTHLLQTSLFTEDDVIVYLRICIRRDLFDLYLNSQARSKTLSGWLKEKRRIAKIDIYI